jgi:dolichol-phosphate mannosyltransferase
MPGISEPSASHLVSESDRQRIEHRLQEILELLRSRPSDSAAGAPEISVVSPVFQAEDLVDELVRQITAALQSLNVDYEIVLVDDGSRDSGWLRIVEAARRDPRVKGVRLIRNFGQHIAITAGLDIARGDWVVVMDCDLQDDPRFIPDLLAKARGGFDVVYGVKSQRRHGWAKNVSARFFASVLRWLGGAPRNLNVGTYSVLSRRAVEAFRSVRDVHRHYLGVLRWLDLPSAEVAVEHRTRPRGTSSYDLLRLLRHAAAGITTQSDRLLFLALGAGGLFLCLALAAAALLVALYLLHGFREGWTSTIVLMLLSTSAVLLAVGAVGVYVAHILREVQRRPLYLTRDAINL